MPAQLPALLERVMALGRVDFNPSHRQPPTSRVVLATVLAVASSLAADAVLVALGEAVFPATKGYVHFQPHDYGRLTVIGVVIACLAWPVVTRFTAAPRWVFMRLAVVVTLVLWLPDLWLLYKGQPGDAVGVLMVMHIAIAVVTYKLLVRVARVRRMSGDVTGSRVWKELATVVR
jgi:Na+/proline symporter